MNTPLDRRTFLGACAAQSLAPALPAIPRRAALYIYSRPRLRPQHAKIVELAIAQRVAAHTSGWRGRDGAPLCELGPVGRGASHWQGTKWVKEMDLAWPFAAVLEYDQDGQPEAYIDWFRRAADAQSPDAWLLDPGVGYAEHINAELATHRDERAAYLGLVDTPTGGHVGGSQFAVRARVRWADGTRVQSGWWLQFEVDRQREEVHWRMVQTPLVDWRAIKTDRKLGIVATAPVADLDRELAVWATPTVFRFPPLPAGLTAGR